MKIFFHWLIAALAIVVTAYVVPGSSVTLVAAIIAAVGLGVLNVFLKPILFVLTLPITILTLGLFSLILNGLLVWLASAIVPGFMIAGFWHAVLFAVVLMLVNWVFDLWK